MKKRFRLLVGGAITLFAISGHSPIFSATRQQSEMKTEKPMQSRPKAIKQGGWRVPGSDEFKTVSTVKERQIDNVKVTQKVFESGIRPVVDVDGYTVGSIDKQDINVALQVVKKKKRLFDVRGFSTYEVNGRVFAYGVTLVPLVIEDGIRTYAGAMYSLFYYDEDGDGRFESRYTGLPLPAVPVWARTAQNQPKLD